MPTHPVRSLHFLDKVLLATLLPAVAIVLTLQIREGLENGAWRYRIVVAGAADSESYPVLEQVQDPSSAPELRRGDRLLRVGDFDLRGVTSRGAIMRAHRAALGPRAVITADREGRRFETWIERLPEPQWWSSIPGAFVMIGVATLLLLKASHWRMARHFFVGSCALTIVGAAHFGRLMPAQQIGTLIYLVARPVASGVMIAYTLQFNDSALPLRRWQRALPIVVGALIFFGAASYRLLPPLVSGVSNRSLEGLTAVIGATVMLSALTRTYRRSDPLERRQLKWVLYGFYIGLIPNVIIYLMEAAGTTPAWRDQVLMIAPTAIPLGFAVAILGYHLLDIDRVISATASVTILGVALLGAAIAVVPRLSHAWSGWLGVDPAVTNWALSLAIAGGLIPLHGSLRPWLDRQLFAEQHRRLMGFEQLLENLSEWSDASQLTTRAGERLAELLQPESIATYARDGDLFTPIFVLGRAAPAAFKADSLLVRSLETRTKPLSANDDALDAFDRASLTTLGAELVIPIRRTENLAAFTCLGRKRSGDIYTANDRAMLSAVSDKIRQRLAQLDAEELLRDTRDMQERLRRYVPGAVAAEIAAGHALEPEEREVSVLFVDLRDYTQFAEARAARDVFSTINEYTNRVSRIVKKYGGTVVEFNGDGMMAVFGAPDALPHKERAVVQAGREIVEDMSRALRVGVGIATGGAMVGSIRSVDRWIWSAIGNTTNLASRLQTLTRELEAAIAVDQATRDSAGYACADFVRHDGVAIRGRAGRHTVFTLSGVEICEPASVAAKTA